MLKHKKHKTIKTKKKQKNKFLFKKPLVFPPLVKRTVNLLSLFNFKQSSQPRHTSLLLVF